ncbi:MAG: DUF192 domain-containing protein [Proteobacteria bacterium]|nr:DUF192 domain-containing protein [Pseudomonadota bacterium]
MSNDPPLMQPLAASSAVALPTICAGARLRVFNATRARPLAERLALALTSWQRLRGLIGRPPLAAGEALLLRPCAAVHGAWMRVAIDVIFLDAEGRVVGLVAPLRPWRQSGFLRGACAALELPVGTVTLSQSAIGDEVVFVPAEC